MQIRPVLFAIIATAALSTAALAATTEPHDTNRPASRPQMADACAALESQFQSAISDNQNAPKARLAASLGSMGTTECNANQGDEGVHKLQQALIDLGVRPAA